MSIQYTRFSLIIDVPLDAKGIANMAGVNEVITAAHAKISAEHAGVVAVREQKMYTPKAKKSVVTSNTIEPAPATNIDPSAVLEPHVAEAPGPILQAIAESEAKDLPTKAKSAKAA